MSKIQPAAPAAPFPPRRCALADCQKEIPRGEEYSFIITLATRGPDARAGAFQCPPAEEIAAGNLDAQHFCCCIEHAAIVTIACIEEHILPMHHNHLAYLAQLDADAEEARKVSENG